MSRSEKSEQYTKESSLQKQQRIEQELLKLEEEKKARELIYENTNYREEILKVINAIESKFLEREELTRIAILALFSEKNCFLIGKPGVGKTAFCSMVSQVINDCRFYEMQFSAGTKEEDIIDDNLYEGTTILTSEVLFFDEMFKAASGLLNKFLSIMNERYLTIRGKAEPVNAKMIIAASNELPIGAVLDPFVDRLHFMFEVVRIQDEENRRKFILGQFVKDKSLPRYFTFEEASYMKKKSLEVTIPKEFQDVYLKLMNKTIKEGLKCTDRKYGHTIEILKMSAFLNNRTFVNASDIFIFRHIGWTTYNERGSLKRILNELMFGNKIEVKEKLTKIEQELEKVTSVKESEYKGFLQYSHEFNGKQKEILFSSTRDDISELSMFYKNYLDEINNIDDEYKKVLNIEDEINKNVFVVGVKNQVFTEEVLRFMDKIYNHIAFHKNEIEMWLIDNRILYDYEEKYYAKNKI